MADLNEENRTICLNLTVEESIKYIYTDVEFILILICIPVLSISGLLLNSAYLFVLYRVRDMRTTTNFYLGNLAVADSSLLLMRLTRYVGTYFYSPVDVYAISPFSNVIICGLPILLINFFHFVSVFFISLVALERYNSICRPLTHRRVSSKLQTFKYTLLAWTLSFVFASCHMGSFDLQKGCVNLPSSSSSVHYKVCHWKTWVAISILLFVQCQFWTAFIGNCKMYIAIVRKLSMRNHEIDKLTKHCKSTQERNQVAKMLIFNACVFFIFLMPMRIYDMFSFLDLLGNFDSVMFLPSSFFWIATVTSVTNSVVNPLIYGATNPNYRNAFQRAFFSPCSTARTNTLAIDMHEEDGNRLVKNTLRIKQVKMKNINDNIKHSIN